MLTHTNRQSVLICYECTTQSYIQNNKKIENLDILKTHFFKFAKIQDFQEFLLF